MMLLPQRRWMPKTLACPLRTRPLLRWKRRIHLIRASLEGLTHLRFALRNRRQLSWAVISSSARVKSRRHQTNSLVFHLKINRWRSPQLVKLIMKLNNWIYLAREKRLQMQTKLVLIHQKAQLSFTKLQSVPKPLGITVPTESSLLSTQRPHSPF